MIADTDCNVVRTIFGPTGEGMHRVAWDLRYPSPSLPPERAEGADEDALAEFRPQSGGPLVMPGKYTIKLFTKAEGTVTEVGQQETFNVVADTASPVRPEDRQGIADDLAPVPLDHLAEVLVLDVGAVLRPLLVRLGICERGSEEGREREEESALLLGMHHIVSDGWSFGVTAGELAALYGAFSRGLSSPLPELPLQYGDFAALQRSWLQCEALESEVSFWRRQLTGLPPYLELPTDRPRPAIRSPSRVSGTAQASVR